ncbi:MAG: redox-regulated ATPase YchF [bacterium]|nr:redox-regulated ATPase YchF [bacterium]
MAWSWGLVGLPNAGKSTVFNALTRGRAETGVYPFTTVDPHRGAFPVADGRLDRLRDLAGSRSATPAAMEVVDIAGLVRGASRGEGLGNQFLAHIREADAIIHVLRCFESPRVSHPEGSVDPVRDREVVLTELALADLETVRRRRDRVIKPARLGERPAVEELALLERVEAVLDRGSLPGDMDLAPGDRAHLSRELFLLTVKPCVCLANAGDDDLSAHPWWEPLSRRAEADGIPLIPLRGRLEAELAELDPGEREEFARDLGLDGAGGLIAALKVTLGLISFFTCNANEARAWLVPAGTTAVAAAGKVHSDMEEGFVRAEVVPYHALVAAGSLAAAREQGLTRIEGRDYPVAEGDIIHFRFRPPAL